MNYLSIKKVILIILLCPFTLLHAQNSQSFEIKGKINSRDDACILTINNPHISSHIDDLKNVGDKSKASRMGAIQIDDCYLSIGASQMKTVLTILPGTAAANNSSYWQVNGLNQELLGIELTLSDFMTGSVSVPPTGQENIVAIPTKDPNNNMADSASYLITAHFIRIAEGNLAPGDITPLPVSFQVSYR